MQALAKHEDRAVVTGIRNMARFIGGSFGLAISSGLLNASKLKNRDGASQPPSNYDLGLNRIWWLLFGIGILVFIVGFGVKDVGLERDEQAVPVPAALESISRKVRDTQPQGIEMQVSKGTV